MADEGVKNPNTELRVILTEDRDGNLDIKYQAYVAGTEVAISMRPSHIAGQLLAGATLVMAEKYSLLKPKQEPPLKSNSKSKGR